GGGVSFSLGAGAVAAGGGGRRGDRDGADTGGLPAVGRAGEAGAGVLGSSVAGHGDVLRTRVGGTEPGGLRGVAGRRGGDGKRRGQRPAGAGRVALVFGADGGEPGAGGGGAGGERVAVAFAAVVPRGAEIGAETGAGPAEVSAGDAVDGRSGDQAG